MIISVCTTFFFNRAVQSNQSLAQNFIKATCSRSNRHFIAINFQQQVVYKRIFGNQSRHFRSKRKVFIHLERRKVRNNKIVPIFRNLQKFALLKFKGQSIRFFKCKFQIGRSRQHRIIQRTVIRHAQVIIRFLGQRLLFYVKVHELSVTAKILNNSFKLFDNRRFYNSITFIFKEAAIFNMIQINSHLDFSRRRKPTVSTSTDFSIGA